MKIERLEAKPLLTDVWDMPRHLKIGDEIYRKAILARRNLNHGLSSSGIEEINYEQAIEIADRDINVLQEMGANVIKHDFVVHPGTPNAWNSPLMPNCDTDVSLKVPVMHTIGVDDFEDTGIQWNMRRELVIKYNRRVDQLKKNTPYMGDISPRQFVMARESPDQPFELTLIDPEPYLRLKL